MTKSQLVTEITKRLGDPTGAAFGDRTISYFVESIHELYASLSEVERINTSSKAIGRITTNISGIAQPNIPQQTLWSSILGVNINGVPATPIDSKEYSMMLSNSMYAPSFDEYYYYFDGRQIVILTGEISTEIRYEILHYPDPTNLMESIADDEDVPFVNSLIVKAIPATVGKLAKEVGLML